MVVLVFRVGGQLLRNEVPGFSKVKIKKDMNIQVSCCFI